MEYILGECPGEICFDPYLAYLESIRARLPSHVYAFAANPHHFNLDSHSSLHDSWLESLVIREAASGARQGNRRLEIAISLLGPFHDLRIHLLYTGVSRYSFVAAPRHDQVAHGDLFTHEIRLGPKGLVVHELLFQNDATFLIECSDIRHSEEVIEA